MMMMLRPDTASAKEMPMRATRILLCELQTVNPTASSNLRMLMAA